MSKVIWNCIDFALLWAVIGLETRAAVLNPLLAFFPRTRLFAYSNPELLYAHCDSFLCFNWLFDYDGFSLMTFNRKALYRVVYVGYMPFCDKGWISPMI